jgi:transcriptional regulator with XRE-family HTH domain
MSMRGGRKSGRNKDNEMSPALGHTIQRLRKAYNMSLGELSVQSGVAKSIISQIERNETNPTIGTVWRLSKALDASIDEVLKSNETPNILQHQKTGGVPILTSEDGKCRLAIIGALETVEWVQWYDFCAEPGGTLTSEAHQAGCVEHIAVLAGELDITVDDETVKVKTGETLRFRGDRPHSLHNAGNVPVYATMVDILRLTVIDQKG